MMTLGHISKHKRFTPAMLFSAGEQGAYYDFSKIATLFSDTAGTTPATSGGPVGYATDLSGRSHPMIAPSDASRPYAAGVPVSLGSELLANGTFATDTAWTKGTGWTISGGVATKAAGTASAISQAVTLVAGSVYAVFVDISRSAGTLQVRLTGGTTVSGMAIDRAMTTTEYLIAVTGNTTLEFYADASFAGTVKTAYLRKGASLVSMGVFADGLDDQLITGNVNLSATNKMTIAASFWTDLRYEITAPYEVGALYSGGGAGALVRRVGTADNFWTLQGGNYITRGTPYTDSSRSHTEIIELDFSQATAADIFKLTLSGVQSDAAPTAVGTMVVGALPNAPVSLFSTANSLFFSRSVFRKFLVINRAVTSGERANLDAWLKAGPRCAAIGDSTIAANTAPDGFPAESWSVPAFLPDAEFDNFSIAVSGEKIADQKARWIALPGKTALAAVFIQVGLNDLNTYAGAGKTSAQMIADLQDLVATVRAGVSAGCKIYISQLTPARAWLGAFGGTSAAAYGAWQVMNEAIAGGGATPITGVDGRITSHVAALNDGSDNLASEFDHNGDGVHENNYGRFLIAQAWRAQLVADGLIPA